MNTLAKKCVGCNVCVNECAFLKKYGNPGNIVTDFSAGNLHELIPFECSLCGLCTSLCPKDLDPCTAFLGMRSKVFAATGEVLPEHRQVLAYEKKGLSKRYSLYKLPETCSTVFFPGCTFTGTRAARTEQVYAWLRQKIPNTGIVLDCCTKPSHDLGRDKFFNTHFSAMENFLVNNGVQKVITACPNCYKVFSTYAQNLETESIYEILADKGLMTPSKISGRVTIHDPCVTRFETGLHGCIRKLVKDQGLEIKEMEHSREKTTCCGEGGSAFSVTPDLASAWRQRRTNEAGHNRIITYCAGCCAFLGKSVQTDHILDLLFEPEKTMDGSVKTSTPPFTYLARINLKRRFKKKSREEILGKDHSPMAHPKKVNFLKILVFILLAFLSLVAVLCKT